MTNRLIILRWWQISRRSTQDSRYPGEKKLTYEEFSEDDDLIQRKLMLDKQAFLNIEKYEQFTKRFFNNDHQSIESSNNEKT